MAVTTEEADKTVMPKEDNSSASNVTTFAEFLEGSTVHGARHTVDNSSKIKRWWWIFVVVVMTSALVTCVTTFLIKYTSYPTTTVTTVRQATEFEFPAVTICNVNDVRKSSIEALNGLVADYLRSKSWFNYPPFSIDPSDEPQVREELLKIDAERFFLEGKHQMNMFTTCLWQTEMVNCNDWVTPSTMRDRYCYTFNSQEAIDARGGPLITTRVGAFGGILIDLNVESNEYAPHFATTAGTGLQVVVHDPTEYPDFTQSFHASAGTITKIALHKKETTGLPPPYQGSWCEEKVNTEVLKYHRNYSRSACVEQCYKNNMVEMCGCRPPVSLGDEPVCPFGDIDECSRNAQWEFCKNASVMEACGCHFPCKETTYMKTMSSLVYPSTWYARNIIEAHPGATLQYLRDTLMQVQVFFQDYSRTEVTQERAYTLTSFASDMGGLMGLFLGASIMSVLEIGDFFCHVVLLKCCRKSKQKVADSSKQEISNNKVHYFSDNYNVKY